MCGEVSLKVSEQGSDMMEANRAGLTWQAKMSRLGNGAEGTWSQGDLPEDTEIQIPGAEYGLWGLRDGAEGSSKDSAQRELIQFGKGLKVADEAIKDNPMVSCPSVRRSGWGTQCRKKYV